MMNKTTLQTMDYCADCQRQTLHVCIHTKERCNNLLHFILVLFTGGLWIIIWILAALCCEDSTTNPACTICGSTETRTPKEIEHDRQARRALLWLLGIVGVVGLIAVIGSATASYQTHAPAEQIQGATQPAPAVASPTPLVQIHNDAEYFEFQKHYPVGTPFLWLDSQTSKWVQYASGPQAPAFQQAYDELSEEDRALYISGKHKVVMLNEQPTAEEQAVIDRLDCLLPK
jgi:hypothetical protein